jgi:hypothetical protein
MICKRSILGNLSVELRTNKFTPIQTATATYTDEEDHSILEDDSDDEEHEQYIDDVYEALPPSPYPTNPTSYTYSLRIRRGQANVIAL